MPSLRQPLKSAIVIAALTLVAVASCTGDATRVDGAVARAAAAVASRDPEALLEVLDERSRSALQSVYRARQQAAATIRESYPDEAQADALAELGDAATAESAADLFRMRCPDTCVATLGAPLGAPRSVREAGDLTVVTTVRDTELTLYRGKDGRYGLVWQTDAWIRERSRAAAELDLIQKNARAYATQRALRESAEAP
jgi:hypothetical protein